MAHRLLPMQHVWYGVRRKYLLRNATNKSKGTLLDSDANLLLLGDGSLICNNCTYSCNACGNKIEDLAILTGDQAFCSACFRCRNCKKKIENLRYARTSQGIFCMSCHEALMARRRKRSKPKSGANGASATKEKALPSLPPGAASQALLTPDVETPESEGAPSAKSPPERQHQGRADTSHSSDKRDVSPLAHDASRGGFTHTWRLENPPLTNSLPDGQTLPASTYVDPKSPIPRQSDDGEEFRFLPMAFDPNPVAAPPSIQRKEVPRVDPSPLAQNDSRSRDYFGGSQQSHRDMLREERPGSARDASAERRPNQSNNQVKPSPHIWYQEKGRQRKREGSGSNTPASGSTGASPSLANVPEKNERTIPQQLDASSGTPSQSEGFKLQDVPKAKKERSRSGSKVEGRSPSNVSALETDVALSQSPKLMESPGSDVNPFEDPKLKELPAATYPPAKQAERPARGDSLTPAMRKAKTPTPDLPTPTAAAHERKASTSSVPSLFADAQSTLSRDNSRSKPPMSPATGRTSLDVPPPRASSRPGATNKAAVDEEFTAPRAPPAPPPASSSTRGQDSIGSTEAMSPVLYSPSLPTQNMDAPFSMEEEMARIMRGDSKRGEHPPTSVLRKVSNAVKHGRSFSDRGLNSAGKLSSNGAPEISSPITISSPILYSPRTKENTENIAVQLRRAQQRIAALESEVNRYEEKMNSSAEIKAANNELREKRTTMVVLDTQREMVVRELEVMTEHLSRAKDSSQPLDLNSLKSGVLKEFAESLQKLKDAMSAQIEDLMHKRNQLTEEIGNLIQMKDKGFQEYESLSNKNGQLLQMNSQLVQSIQEMSRSTRNGSVAAPNGLGIYHPGAPGTADIRELNLISADSSMANLMESKAEPLAFVAAPTVVDVRKGQAKKFDWRKGGEKMAKNVTKGLKGAFASERRKDGEGPYNIGMPYDATKQAVGGSDQSSLNGGTRGGLDANRAGPAAFGFFGQKNGTLKPGMVHMKDMSNSNLAAADASGKSSLPVEGYSITNTTAVLFGSELEARCEYERSVLPGIVTRCIVEVESRGIDMEGIYRKSGGAGQVKMVQQGFEKDTNFDISDSDLDIHSVTSALKQYFRKLPTPLITFDVYDNLLEAGRLQDGEKQALALRVALAELPEHHRDCLEYLVQHLARVMAQESENLMTPLNLAVVFAPTIMRPLSIEREMSDMQAQRIAVQALLEHHQVLFPEE